MFNGYEIKKAGVRSIFDIAKVHVDCWKTTYRGVVPDEKLDGMSYEKSAAKWKEFFAPRRCATMKNTVLVVKKDKETVGFCAGGDVRKFSKRTEGYKGEIKALYILKDHQRRGIGRSFIKYFEEIFRKKKIFSYIIWVLKDNPSKGFYRKMGGKLLTTKMYEIGGRKLKGLCFGVIIENGE